MLPAAVAVVAVALGATVVLTARPWQMASPAPGTASGHAGHGTTTVSTVPSTPPAPSTAAPSSPAPSPSNPAAGAAAQRLAACRAKVASGDAVIAEGKVGVGHWNEHVQAQTDANRGSISLEQMNAIFARTRLAGPADLQRYDAVRASYDRTSGDCRPAPGTTAQIATQLASCQQRFVAQAPVLQATAAAMTDWRNHQADMARSRHEHVPNAQDVWNKAWAAAPKNLNPWKAAVSAYRPPAC